MAAKVNIIPTEETANRSRLTMLLIDGGTQVLRNILLELLFDFHLQRKKDDIQSQVGISIYQQQFELLFPSKGDIPRLQNFDVTLLTFVSEKVLDISLGVATNQAPFIIEKILGFLEGKGFSSYLEVNKTFLESLGNQRRKHTRSLYPVFRKVRVSDLDITVLSFLLLNAFNLKPSSGVWNKMPLDTHTELGDDIVRLREWRNFIFHRTTAGIEKEVFNEIWESMTELLRRRLGDSTSLTTELLKRASIDPTFDDRHEKLLKEWFVIDTELRDALRDVGAKFEIGDAELIKMMLNMETPMDCLVSEIEKLQTKVNRILMNKEMEPWFTRKMSKESFFTNWHVTKLLYHKLPTDYMRSVVHEWKQSDSVFYETKAATTVSCQLKQKSIVTITGAPGSGKKAIARHTALGFHEKGYHIYPVKSPNKITDYFCDAVKQLFYVDNPGGELKQDREELAKWERCNGGIQNLLKKQHLKILVITSPPMLKLLEKSNLVLTRNVVCITDQSCKLTNEEKSKIFDKHCPSSKPSFKVLNCPFDCFPLLCYIYASDIKLPKDSRRSQIIFENPFHVVKQTFEKIRERNGYQFCGMLLCAIIDELHENLFDSFIDDDTMTADRDKMNKILVGMGFQAEVSYMSVKRELDLISNLYVQNTQGSYIFVHQIFRDVVLYLAGTQSIGFIFQFFPAAVIREKVVISSSGENLDGIEQHLIVVHDTSKVQNMLKTRILRDLRNSKYEDAFVSTHLTKDSHAELLLEEIERMNDKQRGKYDDSGKTMLHWSVSQSMVTVTSCLLEAGLEINSQDENGCSAIFYACRCDLLSILIEHLANLDLINIHGETALLRNLLVGHDLVQMLLDHKADVNLHGENNDTALVRAANYNDIHLVKLLICHGADVNGRRVESDTAIVKAAYHNNVEIVKLLIDNGASVDLHGRYGDTALIHATQHENMEIVQLLLRKSANVNIHGAKYDVVEIDHPDMFTSLLERQVYSLKVLDLVWKVDIFRETSIVKAAKKDNFKMVKLLLEHEANPNLYGEGPHSALVKAAYHNNLEMTRLLIDHGANVNLKCTGFRYIDTAIVNAAFHNNDPMIRLFLDHNADVNFRGEERDAAIVKSAYNNNTKMAVILLEKGADVNLHGRYSDSAIVRAVYHNNTEMVRIFLMSGAKPNSCGVIGDPAFGKASYKNNMEIMQMLIENGVDVNKHRFGTNTPITNATYHRNMEMVQKLLNKGAKVNLPDDNIRLDGFRSAKNDRPNTSMMKKILLKLGNDFYIQCEGREEDVKLFAADAKNLRLTENIHLFTKKRKTALMQAAYNNDLEIMKLLLEHDADVNCFSEGFDPAIVSASRNNNFEMTKILVCHNADVNLHIKSGDPAVVQAARHNNMPMLKYLVSHGADINLCGINRDSAVVHTTHHDNIPMLKYLLSLGADVNLCGCERDSALVRATRRNNTRMVKLLVARGSKVNYHGTNRDAALFLAVKNDNMQLVTFFLSKGADVNLKSCCCNNALSKAVQNKNTGMVQLLLDHGADCNVSCKRCDTFLARAVRFNNERMVNLLLQNNANVNTFYEKRNSPIALAAERNNDSIVKCLLDHGADANIGPKHLDKPLVIACSNNNNKIVKLLLDANAYVDSCVYGRCSALAKAVYHDNLVMLILLLDNGANISRPGHVHGKAVVRAVKDNNITMVKLLLDRGMYLTDANKRVMIYGAINMQNKDIVSLLLDHGVSVNLPSKEYNTPLARAIRLHDTEMAILLLCAGAMDNVNKTSSIRDTALVNAAYNNNTEIVKLLLDLGADTNLHTKCKVKIPVVRYTFWINTRTRTLSAEKVQTLINMANYDSTKKYDYIRTMVNQLLYFYPRVHLHDIGNTALGEATYHNNMEMVKMLLNHGAKVNKHGAGDLPLVNAVSNNNISMVELLIQHGAIVNVQSMFRETAIVKAANHSNMEIARLLINKGAIVNACGEFTHPALYTAVCRNNAEMAKLLLEHGADVNYYDGSCDTALSKARHYQNADLVKMLLNYGADENMFSVRMDPDILKTPTKETEDITLFKEQ